MRIFAGLLGFFVLIAAAMGHTYTPKSGYVPDAKTAIAIAQAVLIPVYGEKQIASEQPLHASLKNNVWTVEGTLNCPTAKAVQPHAATEEPPSSGSQRSTDAF